MLPTNPGGYAAYQDLALAGDGTPVRAAARQQKKNGAVAVNVIIPSPTATGDGIPIGNAISLVTISTCMWLPIPTVTFLFCLF